LGGLRSDSFLLNLGDLGLETPDNEFGIEFGLQSPIRTMTELTTYTRLLRSHGDFGKSRLGGIADFKQSLKKIRDAEYRSRLAEFKIGRLTRELAFDPPLGADWDDIDLLDVFGRPARGGQAREMLWDWNELTFGDLERKRRLELGIPPPIGRYSALFSDL